MCSLGKYPVKVQDAIRFLNIEMCLIGEKDAICWQVKRLETCVTSFWFDSNIDVILSLLLMYFL